MQLSDERIDQLSRAFLVHQQRRGSTSSPHAITNSELRKLRTWIALFSLNAPMTAQLVDYLRDRGRERRRQRMEQTYRGYMSGLAAVENDGLVAQARLLLPSLTNLNKTTPINPSEFDFPLLEDDKKAIQVVRWFKHTFMRWVDPIKCPDCGRDATHQASYGHEGMTPEERRVAGRVEIWRCDRAGCGGVDRFLRLNDLGELLQSRRGRCGEFANLFTLFLHTLSLQWRIVVNAEDHVWNEYWSASARRWVHLDPSEGSADQPLGYDLGWGKKQSYCIAFGPAGGKDVTRGYVSDWGVRGGCQERRVEWLDEDLVKMLEDFTAQRRSPEALDRSKLLSSLSDLQQQDIMEEAYLADYEKRVAAAREKRLGGRTSGTLDWRARRQEVGLDSAPPSGILPREIATTEPILDMTTGLSDLFLYGSADIVPSTLDPEKMMISLTPLETDKTGTAFLIPGIKASDSYVLDMDFRMRKRDGQDGADGMGLVVLSVGPEEVASYREADGQVRVVGDGGAGLGYTGLGGKEDFAIELDTYRSVDRCNDPPTPHISLHQPPNSHHKYASACTTPDTIPDIADGGLYSLRIKHQVISASGGQTISAWLRTPSHVDTLEGGNGDEDWLFLWRFTLSWHSKDDSYQRVFAFTASTGGLAQAHEVCDWRLWKVLGFKAEPLDETDTITAGGD